MTHCATPNCFEPRIEGRRFCADCAENLSRIARELKEDPALLWNKRQAGAAGKKTKRPPTCCKVGCFEVRPSGERFCYDHASESCED